MTDSEELRLYLMGIIESSDDAILSKDLNGVIRTWNKGAERIFGYTADEVVGKPVTMLIPEGRLDEEPAILSRIRNGEQVDHYETLRIHKNGSLIDISLTVSPIKDLNGLVIGASKIARDISAQRRNEELQNYHAAIVESSDDAILSKDLNGIIKSWNHGAQNVFGYASHEIVGQPVTVLIPEGHKEEEVDILARLSRGEKIDHFETVRQRKDGRLVDISLTVSPIKDRNGKIIGASKIARDISKQKAAEKEILAARNELAALNEALERRIVERTEALQDAVTEMEEFSSSVTHDLRSPVRAIRGYAEALVEDCGVSLQGTAAGYVDKIIRGTARMETLIKDVLNYSKLARADVVLTSIDLERMVANIIENYPDMQKPGLVIDIQKPLLRVLAHESSLTQALSNLLSNAVKFVASGKLPHITIKTEKRGDIVRVWVIDQGIGIKPQHQKKLFGMFERATQGTKYEGTGVGLAIVRKAMEKIGGRAGVESDGLMGSSFWLDLPS